jgi:hypothetical protein
MHAQGGRLYGTTNTGHMLYLVFCSKTGLMKDQMATREGGVNSSR